MGTKVSATLSGDFGGCDPSTLLILWDGATVPASPEHANTLVMDFAVPSGASASAHEVGATCRLALQGAVGETSVTLRSLAASFQVEQAAKPDLEPAPSHGVPGSSVDASGTGFLCTTDSTGNYAVDLSWDGGSLATTTADADGRFSQQVQVPPDASAGDHRVTATCAGDPGLTDTKPFTVDPPAGGAGGNQGGTSPDNGGGGGNPGNGGGGDNPANGGGAGVEQSGTSGGSTSQPTGWVIGSTSGGAVLLAVGAAVLLLRRHRAPRWARAHVRTALRLAGVGQATLEETPDGRPGAGIRLESRSDPGTQTLRETDS